ncbi:MAG: L-threonylcarbamoyladenylate synthase [bacterium]|nr:L-threonylcarbamoyladenylate synthase [bacterium]MDZ4299956.1 L-threonylcarbamoyladenylate synthase [Candidatus Sungbacteria bacterium]
MEIVALEHSVPPELITCAVALLRGGGVAILPTDTVYGMVCDASNAAAIRRMFALKKRPKEKAFPVFVRDIPTARRLAYIADAKARFLERVWPGAVTVLFNHKGKLPKVLTGGSQKIGMRMPDHPLLRALLDEYAAPLAQTSANTSGAPPAKTSEEVCAYFPDGGDEPDLFVDAGAIAGAASTIIDYSGNQTLLVRTGVMSRERLDELFKSML